MAVFFVRRTSGKRKKFLSEIYAVLLSGLVSAL